MSCICYKIIHFDDDIVIFKEAVNYNNEMSQESLTCQYLEQTMSTVR